MPSRLNDIRLTIRPDQRKSDAPAPAEVTSTAVKATTAVQVAGPMSAAPATGLSINPSLVPEFGF